MRVSCGSSSSTGNPRTSWNARPCASSAVQRAISGPSVGSGNDADSVTLGVAEVDAERAAATISRRWSSVSSKVQVVGSATSAARHTAGELWGRRAESGATVQQQLTDEAPVDAVSTSVSPSGTAAGAQHVAESAALGDICSASPVLTYHSHLAPSGSVTQVSVLVA